MRAEYICGKAGWKTRWRCVRCRRPLVKELDAQVAFIRALCHPCTRELLDPTEIWSQHSYGVAIDVNS